MPLLGSEKNRKKTGNIAGWESKFKKTSRQGAQMKRSLERSTRKRGKTVDAGKGGKHGKGKISFR